MQVKTFLFSLSVAALTACAVDDTSQQQAAIEEAEVNPSPNPTRVIEQVKQHAKESKRDMDEIIAMPMDDKDSGEADLRAHQEQVVTTLPSITLLANTLPSNTM